MEARRRRSVEVDVELVAHRAVADDVAPLECAHVGGQRQGDAALIEIVLAIDQVGLHRQQIVVGVVDRPIAELRRFGGAQDAAGVGRAAALAQAVDGQASAGVGAQAEGEGHAGALDVFIVDVAVVGDVAQVAVARLGHDAEGHTNAVAQLGAAVQSDVEAAEVADAGVHLQPRFTTGRLGDVADGAASGVAAVQRALRAPQHFNPLQIEHVEHGARLACDVDVVDVDRHRRVSGEQRFVSANAAHEDLGPAGGARVLLDHDVGHLDFQVIEPADLFGLQLARTQGRDGQRRLLQFFLPALCRHRDHRGFFDSRGGRLRPSQWRGQGHRHRRAQGAHHECGGRPLNATLRGHGASPGWGWMNDKGGRG